MNSIGKPLNYEGPLYAPHPDLVKIKPVFGGCYNYKRLKEEGLMKGYGPDGSDFYRFARIIV